MVTLHMHCEYACNDPLVRKHPYCSKDLGNSLPNSASTKLHFIVFYKKVVLVYASKLRLNVFDIDGDLSLLNPVGTLSCGDPQATSMCLWPNRRQPVQSTALGHFRVVQDVLHSEGGRW